MGRRPEQRGEGSVVSILIDALHLLIDIAAVFFLAACCA